MRWRGLSGKERLRFSPAAVAIVLSHNLIHEGVHYLAALLSGEPVAEFRFLTNGWGTSQVVYAAPVGARSGMHWLFIAFAPSLATTLIGYCLYLNRKRFLDRGRAAVILALYAGFFFLMLDPLYLSFLSVFFGGDIGAVAAVGWSEWSARALLTPVVLFNVFLYFRWLRELRRSHFQENAPAVPSSGR